VDDQVKVLIVGASVAVSCFIAYLASAGKASAAWGLLGPVGWTIAAIASVRAQQAELHEMLRTQLRRAEHDATVAR
jgi:hypothetical protein